MLVTAVIGLWANKIQIWERFRKDSDKTENKGIKFVLKDTGKIIEMLEKKGADATPQLVAEYEEKIDELKKELEEKAKNKDDTRSVEALAAFEKGDLSKARELFKALVKEIEAQKGEQAKTYHNLGNVYFAEVDFQKALTAYMEAVKLDPENTLYLNDAGFLLDTLGRYDEAIDFFEKALNSDLKTLGEDHPQVAIYRNNLGATWKSKGEYDKAIEYYEKALASDLKTLGEDHPQVAIYRNNLGLAWKAKDEYDKAIGYYKKALESDLKTFDEGHPNVAIRWNNLGGAWESKGEYGKAIEYHEKALAVFRKKLGNDHPDTKTAENNLRAARAEKK